MELAVRKKYNNTQYEQICNIPEFNSLSLLGVTLQSNCKFSEHVRQKLVKANSILGDPGAISRDDATFLGESLLQELKSPWELILTEPVPEVVEFHPTDWVYIFLPNQR